MKKEQLIPTLEFIFEWSKAPTLNELEIGFRHHPLTHKEIVERYKDFSDYVKAYMPEIIDMVKELEKSQCECT